MEPKNQAYESWLAAYLEHGQQLESALSEIIQDALNRSSTLFALPELRAERASFPHPFCLCLYSTKYDEALAEDLYKQVGVQPSEETRAIMPEMTSKTAEQALSVLMPLLDNCGLHLLILERENESIPDGPLRLQPPDHMWFGVFTQLAELARFIIVAAGVGPHIMQEILYLRDAGLGRRIVIYLNGKLFYGGDAEEPECHKLDQLAEVAEHAAAQPPAESSENFIANPRLPEWVLKDFERE